MEGGGRVEDAVFNVISARVLISTLTREMSRGSILAGIIFHDQHSLNISKYSSFFLKNHTGYCFNSINKLEELGII